MLSKYYEILSFSCEVMISFRINIIQRTFSLLYRLVSIQTTNCFLLSLVKWGSLTETSLLAASELSCFWHSSPFLPGRDALQFLLHTTAWDSAPSDTLYSTPSPGSPCDICFLEFFILLPFWVRILQDHEECSSYGHQTDSGASGPRPVFFPLSMKSWMCLVEASFSRLARWIFAHWIYQLILMIYILLLMVAGMSCGGREGSCSNYRDIFG